MTSIEKEIFETIKDCALQVAYRNLTQDQSYFQTIKILIEYFYKHTTEYDLENCGMSAESEILFDAIKSLQLAIHTNQLNDAALALIFNSNVLSIIKKKLQS